MSHSIFDYNRAWFNHAFDNPDKVKPIHHAIYYFALEHCNRLGWKEKFGFPTSMVMEAIGVKSYNTYIKAFNELVRMGFIILIKKSENQYQGNIIALSKNDISRDKSLDKSMINHDTNHSSITGEISDSIIRPYTNKPCINKPEKAFRAPSVDEVYNFMTTKKLNTNQAEKESRGFVSYYDSIGWTVGKNKKMINWKSAVTGWINRIEDFKNSPNSHNNENNHKNKSGGKRRLDPETVADTINSESWNSN